MRHSQYSKIIKIKTWDDLIDKHDSLIDNKSFLFRGQTNQKWDLESSLDRFTKITKSKKNKLEYFFLREFQRRFHNYSTKFKLPAEENQIEWLALMQHYGTPTRLLDWTYSFYVAVFFAIEDLNYMMESAVWAINSDWVLNKLRDHAELSDICKKDEHLEKRESFNKLNGKTFVLRLNPYVLHERLSVQQGCFLIPGNINKSFIQNLRGITKSNKELKENIFKFVIPANNHVRKNILRDLYRMNISRASLFPRLDGFASSLKTIAFAKPELQERFWDSTRRKG